MFKKILLVAALLIPMLASAQTLKIGLVDSSDIIAKMPDTATAEANRRSLKEIPGRIQETGR